LSGFYERQKFPEKVVNFKIEFETLNLGTKTPGGDKLEKVS
jgi:hypothetical protein